MRTIERARPEDRQPIEALLLASGLPLDGLEAALPFALVAREDGRLVGVAAVEPYGQVGLLRSVAVNSEQRRQGTGRQLVAASEVLATELGIEQLYLLTETAQAWFTLQGYEPLDRVLLPESLTASAEFRGACPETAVAMRRARRQPAENHPRAAPRWQPPLPPE